MPIEEHLADTTALQDAAVAARIHRMYHTVSAVNGYMKSGTSSAYVGSFTAEEAMRKIQTQGIHHITLIGAGRQTSIDFWEGVLGMPLVFEQPNLDVPEENHLYFDPGDGRLITVFTNERRSVDPARNPEGVGNLHHLAFTVARATYTQIARRLDERNISHTGEVDRGFMDSIYFRDPLGQLIECACYKFEPPAGATHADVLREAHLLRIARGDHHIADEHLADAIELLVGRNQPSLSVDRSAKDPFTEKPPVWG